MRKSAGRQSEDGGAWGGQLISISDLMAGLLFVFIVIVLVFAFKLNKATMEKQNVVDEFQSTRAIRNDMLDAIKERLLAAHLDSNSFFIDPDTGVLSLRENILFPSGSTDLNPTGDIALTILASALADVLPCYAGTMDSPGPSGCSEVAKTGRIEAVFIEGHTDSIPVSATSPFRNNWDLSTARAIKVFEEMTRRRPALDALKNAASQPLFGISGYADRRPYGKDRSANATDTGRARNRRIDVRFVMTYPRDPDAVKAANAELGTANKR
jgi:chemotaxis protein MotB